MDARAHPYKGMFLPKSIGAEGAEAVRVYGARLISTDRRRLFTPERQIAQLILEDHFAGEYAPGVLYGTASENTGLLAALIKPATTRVFDFATVGSYGTNRWWEPYYGVEICISAAPGMPLNHAVFIGGDGELQNDWQAAPPIALVTINASNIRSVYGHSIGPSDIVVALGTDARGGLHPARVVVLPSEPPGSPDDGYYAIAARRTTLLDVVVAQHPQIAVSYRQVTLPASATESAIAVSVRLVVGLMPSQAIRTLLPGLGYIEINEANWPESME